MANEEIREKNIEIALQTAYEQFLIHGIEGTTKFMVAKASGLSRPSIDRYFSTKIDCVIQTAKYVGSSIRISNNYPDSLFADGKHTGKDLLKLYMNRAKALYIENPELFILRNEYKQYVYRHCSNYEQSYNFLLDTLECKHLIKRIFLLGFKDGSFSNQMEPDFEAEYFCESFLGFLGNMALSERERPKESYPVIDKYIERVMRCE